MLLGAGVGWYISRRLSRPLLALTEVTKLMAEGELASRAEIGRRDELGQLAASFNEMAGRVEATVSALRRFVADAAHQLNTPLTALRTNLELMAKEDDIALRSSFEDRAQTQIDRLLALSGGLLDLSRIEGGGGVADKEESVDLGALIQDISEPYASRAEQAGLSFSIELPARPVVIEGNEMQLRQVAGNLLDNAIKFTPEGGQIAAILRLDDKLVILTVEDTGIGILEDDIPQLFGRFHRGRNAAAYAGSGLGLAIVKAIVEPHGGQVTAQNSAEGVRVFVSLPLRE